MKINRMTQNYIGTQKKVSLNKGVETSKDQVALGQKNDDLGIMERPLLSTKSCGTGDIGSALLAITGISAGAGALAAGAGIAGKAFGGGMGVAIATGASALVGGAVLGNAMSGGKGNINVKGFLTGAAALGTLSAAGAGLSMVGPAWVGGTLAVGTGAVGGAGAFIGGMMLFNQSHY